MENRPPSFGTAKHALHIFILADVSASMQEDNKISQLNNALSEATPILKKVAADEPSAKVFMHAITFGFGAAWHIKDVPLEDFEWKELQAKDKQTDMGEAFLLVESVLKKESLGKRNYRPVILLVTDALPNDENWEDKLAKLLANPWGKRATKVAIGVGDLFAEGKENEVSKEGELSKSALSVLKKFTQIKPDGPNLILRPSDGHKIPELVEFALTTAFATSVGNKLESPESVDTDHEHGLPVDEQTKTAIEMAEAELDDDDDVPF